MAETPLLFRTYYCITPVLHPIKRCFLPIKHCFLPKKSPCNAHFTHFSIVKFNPYPISNRKNQSIVTPFLHPPGKSVTQPIQTTQ